MPRPTGEQAERFEQARHAIVRTVRDHADITSGELAQRLGVSYDFVVRFRRALRTDPDLAVGAAASRAPAEPPEAPGPIVPCREHARDVESCDRLLAALRQHHPRGHDNWAEGREAPFRGARPADASGMGCAASLCAESA